MPSFTFFPAERKCLPHVPKQSLLRLCGDKSAAAAFGVTWPATASVARQTSVQYVRTSISSVRKTGRNTNGLRSFLCTPDSTTVVFSSFPGHGAIARKNYSRCIQRFVVSSLRLNRGIASGGFYYRDVIVQKARTMVSDSQ